MACQCSPSTTTPPAFLLHQLARDSHLWNSTLNSIHAPGISNTLADLLSCSFHLLDADVLAKINALAPTQLSWQFAIPPAPLISAVNWALTRQLLPKESPQIQMEHGLSGQPFVETLPVIPSFKTSPALCPSSKFSLANTEWEHWLPHTLQSNLEQWRRPFVPWVRRLPHWATKTLDCSPQVNLTSGCNANYNPTKKQTPHPLGSNPSHCRSFITSSSTATAHQTHAQMPSDK